MFAIFDDIIYCTDCLGFIYVITKQLNSQLPRNDISDHPTIGLLWVYNCQLSFHTCYQSIACLLHRGCGPHTRCTDTAKQKTVAYLSGRGQRRQMFQPRALITLVMPLHWPGSANVATSVCLYREQQRALRFRPIVWLHQMAGLGSPIPGIWGLVSDRTPPLRAPCLRFDRYAMAPDPSTARRFLRPSSCDIDRLYSSVQRGGKAIPRHIVRGPIGHCASLVALPL